MSILAGLHHVTRYHYDRPIGLGPQVIRLRPAPHCRTRVVSYSLKVTPAEHFLNWQQDPNGNWLARFVFPEKTREFTITVDLIADMAVVNPFDFFVEPFADTFPFAYPAEFVEELAPYLAAEPAGPRLSAFLASLPRDRKNIVDFLVELNQRLQRDIRYLIRMEAGVQTPEHTLETAAGSCRDSAWLLVQILRHLGLAARFVSGYLIQLRPDVQALDGPAGAAQDFTDLHAWAEVYIPGAGWIGLDATSGLLCGEGHLPLAATPHYRSAAPISGAVEPAEVTFSFDMKVTRIAEKPRVTYPFSDEAWAALDALGEKVDKDLAADDVRLTMGGEPTFVSIDDYQTAEWNTAALGPTKRIHADALIRRLRDRFAPGGLLHYGQGKWYPGEPLPRWAFALYWRRDGKAIWRDPALIATETGGYRPLAADAQRFTQSLAARLGIDADFVQPAFEDPAERMLKEGELPDNVDPSDPKIDDPVERERIMREFARRLGVPAGYVLPVQRWTAQAAPGWVSEIWQTRRRHLLLMPGDSPIGFRLPLKALPHIKPVDYPHLVPADPMTVRGELPDPELMAQAIAHRSEDTAARAKVVNFHRGQSAPTRVVASPSAASVPVRTALTVEPRDGRLCVFMPPVERL
jgi:transglutaminase-like putative cysteine protease